MFMNDGCMKKLKRNSEKTMTEKYGRLLPTLFTVLLLMISQASAMTIETRFIGGVAPANIAGKGNLTDIVNVAARMWESVFADSITITLNYGWEPIGSAGIHMAVDMNAQKTREISGTILLDNSGAVQFYLDPTPSGSEEYTKSVVESQNLGGGMINVSRIFSQPIGDAIGRVDLLSVVLHEMGHAMGMSLANSSFISQSSTGFIKIGSNLPYAGTSAPMALNSSGIIPHFNVEQVLYGSLMAGLNSDERRIPSELDILINAQVSGYSILSFAPKYQTVSILSIQRPTVSQSTKIKSLINLIQSRNSQRKTIFSTKK
jgi:hypothetical protein